MQSSVWQQKYHYCGRRCRSWGVLSDPFQLFFPQQGMPSLLQNLNRPHLLDITFLLLPTRGRRQWSSEASSRQRESDLKVVILQQRKTDIDPHTKKLGSRENSGHTFPGAPMLERYAEARSPAPESRSAHWPYPDSLASFSSSISLIVAGVGSKTPHLSRLLHLVSKHK